LKNNAQHTELQLHTVKDELRKIVYFGREKQIV